MYKIFEKVDVNTWFLKYESGDLELATNFLKAFRCKYPNKKFVLLDTIM